MLQINRRHFGRAKQVLILLQPNQVSIESVIVSSARRCKRKLDLGALLAPLFMGQQLESACKSQGELVRSAQSNAYAVGLRFKPTLWVLERKRVKPRF